MLENAKMDVWRDKSGENKERINKRKFRCSGCSRENEREWIRTVWMC